MTLRFNLFVFAMLLVLSSGISLSQIYYANPLLTEGDKSTGKRNKEGYRIGRWITVNKQQVVIEDCNYKDGMLSGEFKSFYANKRYKEHGFYLQGNETGVWHYYDTKGELTSEVIYNLKEGYRFEKYYNPNLKIQSYGRSVVTNHYGGSPTYCYDGKWFYVLPNGVWYYQIYKKGVTDGITYFLNSDRTLRSSYEKFYLSGVRYSKEIFFRKNGKIRDIEYTKRFYEIDKEEYEQVYKKYKQQKDTDCN